MFKVKEQSEPNSCFNRAEPGEMVFVLLARDAAAPHAIRAWANERVRLGKNAAWRDPQIAEALQCAAIMERQYPPLRYGETPEEIARRAAKIGFAVLIAAVAVWWIVVLVTS